MKLLSVLTLVVSYLVITHTLSCMFSLIHFEVPQGDEGDCKVSEGLVDHTLESKDVDNAKTEDVDTGGTPNWLRMPKEDEHIEVKKKVWFHVLANIDV